jgi:hypothetical protein
MLRETRSTLIVSAILTLRARGFYERYTELLSPKLKEELLGLIAGIWIPAPLGLEHYRAVEQLALPPSTIEAIGAEMAERTSKTAIHSAVKMSKEIGVTPWAALAQAHRLRESTWRGTDIAVWKLGPKEARYDWVGQPYSEVPYFVTSFNGFMRALISMFCTRAYTHIVPERSTPTSFSIRISWA